MNRWITTREGFDAAEARYREPKDSGLVAQSVQHFYLTDPTVHAETLPPPLLPGDRPEVWVSIGWMESLSLGVAQVALRCQVDLGGDGGLEDGWYCIHLPMTMEAAVVGGRERYGENKKIADITFERTDGHVRGSVTRYGVTYLEVQGDRIETLPVPESESVPHYYFKYSLAADGRGTGNGYDFEPILVRSVHTRAPKALERLDGKLVLRDSATDPVADLPVVEDVGTYYTERTNFIAAARTDVPVDPVAFLPFVNQRYDYPGQG
jgi:acetoacetate decarboxylase